MRTQTRKKATAVAQKIALTIAVFSMTVGASLAHAQSYAQYSANNGEGSNSSARQGNGQGYGRGNGQSQQPIPGAQRPPQQGGSGGWQQPPQTQPQPPQPQPYPGRDGGYRPNPPRDGDRPYPGRDGGYRPYPPRDGDRPYPGRDRDRDRGRPYPRPMPRTDLCYGAFYGSFSNGVRATLFLPGYFNQGSIQIQGGAEFTGYMECRNYGNRAEIFFRMQTQMVPGLVEGRGEIEMNYDGRAFLRVRQNNGLEFFATR
jgi:hypothetical protein